MTTTELVALVDGREVGRVHRDSRGQLRFVYDQSWREDIDNFPLSFSMPLTAAEHRHSRIEAYLWGLLPENDLILERWAKQFHVGRSAFALLAHVGEDCAGAVQFAHPDDASSRREGTGKDVRWLGEREVGERLRELRRDGAAWRRLADSGQFSLAGAQPKTALLLRGRRWGIPSGRVPTTHILKPPLPELAGHVENEHFCLELARSVGIPSARTSVERFDGEIAIVVERYDRQILTERQILRVHQEDMCQALGVMPTRKYQSEGGPSPSVVVELLRDVSSKPSEDVWTFVAALGFSWLTGGTDAHAKNYSLLIGGRDRVRLAPLYDVASILLYPEVSSSRRAKLAMKVGSKYLLEAIDRRQWISTARELRLNPEELIQRLRAMAEQLPDACADVRSRAAKAGLDRAIVGRLSEAIARRAETCRNALQ